MSEILIAKLDIKTENTDEKNALLFLTKYVGMGDVPALLLVSEDGEDLMTPSVNLAGTFCFPDPGNIFIKDWSENSGIFEALRDAGVISSAIRDVRAGYEKAFECKLLLTEEIAA